MGTADIKFWLEIAEQPYRRIVGLDKVVRTMDSLRLEDGIQASSSGQYELNDTALYFGDLHLLLVGLRQARKECNTVEVDPSYWFAASFDQFVTQYDSEPMKDLRDFSEHYGEYQEGSGHQQDQVVDLSGGRLGQFPELTDDPRPDPVEIYIFGVRANIAPVAAAAEALLHDLVVGPKGLVDSSFDSTRVLKWDNPMDQRHLFRR